MKNQIKKFGQFLNESDHEYRYKGAFGGDLGRKHKGIAVWETGDGVGGNSWSMVSFGGESIDIEEGEEDYTEDGEFLGYAKIFRAAAELGADSDMVYDIANDEMLHADSGRD
jgi:hypothetical protein